MLCYVQSLRSCLTLCDLMDYSLPGSLVHGILQARMLEWLPCPLPGDLSYPGTELASPVTSVLQADSLPTEPLGKPSINGGKKKKVKV